MGGDDGALTLTTLENGGTGNATLKNKINTNQSFLIKGRIILGSGFGWISGANLPSANKSGGDGVGIGFHTGNTTDIGQAGQCS